MIKPEIPLNETDRLKDLKSFNLLDTISNEEFDNVTLIASQICQTPIALISLIDEDRQWFLSKIGVTEEQTNRDISFCGHAINNPNSILEVNNTSKDKRFWDNPLVTEMPGIGFYTGIPLISENNYALGTLCVIDTKPRELKELQIKALNALSKDLMVKLETHKKKSELFKSNFDLQVSINNINASILELDSDFTIKFANDSFIRSYKHIKSNVLSKSFLNLLIETEQDNFLKNVSSSNYNFETRIFDGDSTIKNVDISVKKIHNQLHDEKRYLITILDISKKKH